MDDTKANQDDDTFIASINQMMAAGHPIPLEAEERSLRIHLAAHPDRADLLQRLCAVLVAQRKQVPLELEERALLAQLKNHSDRVDMEDRLRIVQVALNKRQPPPPVIGPAGEQASQADVDFQSEAANFGMATNYGDLDADFAPILELARHYTMTSIERMYALYKAVEYVHSAAIPGAIVECGVWRGGSVMVALATLSMLGSTDRNIFLFDTFEGLPKPDPEKDVDVLGNRAMDGWIPHARGERQSNWAYASLDDVKANILTTGYPPDRVHFVKGMVEDTIPAHAPNDIALLRLDTDWYASTRHSMTHLFPRLSSRGVLILDDYGHFIGARNAVDEYLVEHRIPILLNRIDYSGRVGIKA